MLCCVNVSLLLLLLLLLKLLIKLHRSLIVLKDSCIQILFELILILAMHNYSVLRLANFLGLLVPRELTLWRWGNNAIWIQIAVLAGGRSCHV